MYVATILIVEDDMDIHQMEKEYLTKHGETIISAYSGTEALLQLKLETIDVILLDLMLPGMHGEELIHEMKTNYASIPVIIVSAKSDLADKVELLNAGADDYICKPFALEELYARVQVQLRRHTSSIANEEIVYQDIHLLNDQRTLRIANQDINLTKHEYKIMELLMSHPKQGFTKKEIYEYAWDDYFAADDKTINVHISNIRTKCACCHRDIIETIWGIGFKMKG